MEPAELQEQLRLNRLLPGFGDAVEFIARWTAVKSLVDWWTS